MKKTLIAFLVTFLVIICMFCLWSCGNIPTTQPQKLDAPMLVLTGNTVTWEGNQNAERFEISIDGNLSFVENTVSSKSLTNGQTIKIRAIGDGTNYLNSDWSNAVTYTETTTDTDIQNPPLDTDTDTQDPPLDTDTGTDTSTDTGTDTDSDTSGGLIPDDPNPDNPNPPVNPNPPAEDAPVYLGIVGSKEQPSEDGDVPESIKPVAKALSLLRANSQYRTYEEALEGYFANEDNHLGTYPNESQYDLYATPNETIYIQIWLNNPAQYTILSLKLNGVKYQVGRTLSSFFMEDGGVYYNCVYVEIKIPKNDRIEKDYVVTEIEYISGTFINPDGTDEFMNDNDTISIGLPYTTNNPAADDFNTTELSTNSAKISFNVNDTDNLVSLFGGWLGVTVYDGYNVLLNQKANVGDNQITVDGLSEDTSYTVYVYLYGDTHNGNGVMVHTIGSYHFTTQSAVDYFNVEADYYAHGDFTEWGGEEADSGLSIRVDLYLTSPSATYDRVEIYKGDELVLTDTNFNYYKTYEDFLAETTYKVVIYYSDNEYSEHYVEEYVTTGKMEEPEMKLKEVNSFVNSVAILFDSIENGFLRNAIAKNISIRIFDTEYEEVMYENYILDLCDDPTLYDTLKAEYEDAINRGDWGYANILYHEKWYFYERADDLMNNGEFSHFGRDKSKWSEFFSDCSKTFNFGNDAFFSNNGTAYLIFKDYFDMFGEDGFHYEIYADVDMKDGNGFVRKKINDSSENTIVPINHQYNQVSFNINVDGYKITVNPTCRFDGDDYDLAIISYSVSVYKDYWNIIDTIYTSKEINLKDYDEDAWINAYVMAMKGEAILPSEDAIIEYFDWRAIFEILLNVEFPEEDDFDGKGNGESAGDVIVGVDGSIVQGGGNTGRGNKVIANERERQLLRDILAYDYNEDYEYRLKSQMINDFQCDEFYYDLINGLEDEDEILNALIDGALNSSIIRVLNSVIGGIQHYMTWFGSSEDEIYIGFKSLMEEYIEEQNLTPEVNWAESYRRVMMFEDFYYFYPYGEFETVKLEIDKDKYPAGEYRIGVTYRYDSYEEDYYETHFANDSLYITSNLPIPSVKLTNDGYIENIEANVENFWEYHFEVEIKNANGEVIFSGSRDDLTEGNNQLLKGYSIKARTVFNDGATSQLYVDNSEWTEWYTYIGPKVDAPYIDYDYGECGARWYAEIGGNISHYVYTINGGNEIKVKTNGEQLIPLKDSDILKIKAIPSDEGIANGYNESDWAEFICDDDRQQLSAPNDVKIQDNKLIWTEVEGAECYVVEIIKGTERRTVQVDNSEYHDIKPGETYRVRSKTYASEIKSSLYSESITYSIKLDNPEMLKASTSRVTWSQVAYAEGYYYKIGVNGEIKSTASCIISPAKEGLVDGDEIYVQAYADGCISSDWVLIWTYTSEGK
ncbi:MAG: hypothetical protein J6A95_05165 [Clostridia bacterium]|nr:hypothetical protein [Clostridia bacterium]